MRHLAENSAGQAPAERALDPVKGLDDLDLAAQDGKQRALSALGNGEFSGTEAEVGGRACEALQFGSRQVGKQGN